MALFRILLYSFGGMTDWFIKYYVRIFIIILWILFIYFLSVLDYKYLSASHCQPFSWGSLIADWHGRMVYISLMRLTEARLSFADHYVSLKLSQISFKYSCLLSPLNMDLQFVNYYWINNYFVAVFWMLSVGFLLLFYFSWLLNFFHCLEIY